MIRSATRKARSERTPCAAGRSPPSFPAEACEGWAETIWRHGAPPGARLRWLAPGLPVLRRTHGLESLRSPYVTVWGRTDAHAVLRSGARHHHLEALPGEALPRLRHAYAGAGWAAEVHRRFGVWHDDLSGGWDAYWAARPTRLRETVRRKRDRFGPLITLTDEAAVAAQRAVAAEAWQPPEPYARFVEQAIRRGGAEGWLRVYALGPAVCPAALQLWLVGAGWGSLLKTWHRRAVRDGSPGTLLTAAVLRQLASEGAYGFDLGRGDNPYKADWARFRAQRWGVIAAPLTSGRGALIAARTTAKALLRRN